ncbi:hypothetical protein H4R33_007120, partial [Dimargaris cristalligena]
IQTFKPELEWLNKNTHALKANEGSVEVFDAFFPILGKIRTGDSASLTPIIEYVYSDTFNEAMYRQLERWVPPSYVNFLATLLFASIPRTIALSDVDHMAKMLRFYVPDIIKRDLRSTLSRSICNLAVQTNSLQQVMDTGRAVNLPNLGNDPNVVGMDYIVDPNMLLDAEDNADMDFGPELDMDMPPLAPMAGDGPPLPIMVPVQQRHALVEDLSDPEFKSQSHDILGYCAVEAGFIKRSLLPENWTIPTKERLVDQLGVSENEIPQRCRTLFISNEYPVFLDTDGDASI